KWAKKSITGGSNKMRTPDQIAEKSESSIKSQGMIPPWVAGGGKDGVTVTPYAICSCVANAHVQDL
ncbi:hypothetical protein, partial [Aeromonas caviae]|uniref:hypothetical protein n=1 Tax=Aeromonas caviae TaxID=648 RepID=UPI001FC828E5